MAIVTGSSRSADGLRVTGSEKLTTEQQNAVEEIKKIEVAAEAAVKAGQKDEVKGLRKAQDDAFEKAKKAGLSESALKQLHNDADSILVAARAVKDAGGSNPAKNQGVVNALFTDFARWAEQNGKKSYNGDVGFDEYCGMMRERLIGQGMSSPDAEALLDSLQQKKAWSAASGMSGMSAAMFGQGPQRV